MISISTYKTLSSVTSRTNNFILIFIFNFKKLITIWRNTPFLNFFFIKNYLLFILLKKIYNYMIYFNIYSVNSDF